MRKLIVRDIAHHAGVCFIRVSEGLGRSYKSLWHAGQKQSSHTQPSYSKGDCTFSNDLPQAIAIGASKRNEHPRICLESIVNIAC